ncbi:nitrogen assimilation transcription factor nit-4 [Ophiostoma piceae UAMH 11346]|uniref:Nitrogen assimilation transcription factor nit-4 n=1 Tax=Ophiostoma piceae (strain UAMH 11346) TaxID=1262450 RepID=S3C1U9_OPHP1|nr:nitrogen assimilation transcription factor nit-4 [Ophiostoma piceae UAMH 11346]
MASTDDGKHTPSDDSSSIKFQENVAVRGSASRTNKQQVRHRASVACASCRDRRIRCVVPKGESECTQCKRVGSECIIKNDDERRRPISKAYMSSLSERIMLLESMLNDRGVTPPPAVHPPKTRQEGRSQTSQDEQQSQPQHQSTPPYQLQQQQVLQEPDQQEPDQQEPEQQHPPADQIQSQATESHSPPFLSQLNAALSTDGSPSRDDATPPESAIFGQHEDHTMRDDSDLFDPMLADVGVTVDVGTEPVPSLDVGNSSNNAKDMAMLSQSLHSVQSQESQASQNNHHFQHAQHSTQPSTSQHQVNIQTAAMTSTFSNGSYKETSPFRNLDPKKEDIVQRVLSTKGNLSFDQLSGRLRFFGPTANSHVYAEAANAVDSREPPEQVRRSERIIRSLTEATHDYLLACFWEFYNDIIFIIDRDAFEMGRATQNPKFYTSFLHITVLAMGYRFADRSRDDVTKISLGNRESTLQREAKYMLDIELERPGGIPSVQALLLLGDLECGVGRDNTGWMYSGMANRLAFDIGLHLDYRNTDSTDINENEVNIRHMVMKAAIVIDKYWALYLGRPTSIKSQDVGMDLLAKRFSMMAPCPDSAQSSSRSRPANLSNEEIYEYLFELMELAGKIVESRDMHNLGGGPGGGQSVGSSFAAGMSFAAGAGGRNHNGSGRMANNGARNDHNSVFGLNDTEENAYLHVISLDRQLQNWYRRLPDHLTWKPANIKAAPMSFFLLHQQYHVTMILLHRPWAKYGSIFSSNSASTNSHPSPSSTSGGSSGGSGTGLAATTAAEVRHDSLNSSNHMGPNPYGLGDPQCIVDDSRTTLSRSICTQQATRVARIFWQHRQRFDGRRICVTGIQHAGTASIALIAALAYQQSNDNDRRSYLGYLEILSYALTDMSHTYQPASRMDDLLKAVLDQLRSDVYGPDYVSQASKNNSASSNSAHARSYGSDLPGWLSGSASLSGTSSNNNGIDVYSVLPARRENPDSASTLHTFKKRRPTTSRRASELTRHPPSFFAQSGIATSNDAASAAIHSLDGSHINSSSNNILSNFGGQDTFSLDFLSGSAIGGNRVDDPQDTAGLHRSSIDDYVLVQPDSDSWTLSGSSQQLHQQNHHQSHSHGTFDMPIADWIMRDSASGMPTPSMRRRSSKSERHHNARSGESTKPRTSLDGPRLRGPGPAAQVQGALSDDAKHIADWIDPVFRKKQRHRDSDGRPLDALSPIGMTGLVVQTVETSAGDSAARGSNAGTRTGRAEVKGTGSGEPGGGTGAAGAEVAVGSADGAMAGQDEERYHDLDFFRF